MARPAPYRKRAQDAATVLAFKAGWRAVRALPEPAAYALFEKIAYVLHRRGGKDVERMRSNYARVRPELDAAALDDLTREGLRSYFRYWCDAFRLQSLSHDDLRSLVRTTGAIDQVRADLAAGESIVLYLGHLGNWDLAGAWSATELAHVTTVAERLEPDELFRAFLEFREGLGMTIIPLTQGVDVMGQVEAALRVPGAFAPLLSDRDLTQRGVTVKLAGHDARVAAGPAILARRTGARLYPVTITYDPPKGRAMRGIEIRFHDPVDAGSSPDMRADVLAATQQCVDALSTAIVERTEDWHMMQRVFVDDLGNRAPRGN